MSNDINWFIELFKVLPTVIVGLIAALIAWQQMKISKDQKNIAQAKLKLDLFLKRLAVYEDVARLIDSTKNLKDIGDAKSTLEKLIQKSHEATFLFGGEVDAYIEKLALAVYELGKGIKATVDNNGVVPVAVVPEIRKANDFIKNSEIQVIFRPYLDFSNWK